MNNRNIEAPSVTIISDSIVNSLGFNTKEVFQQMKENRSGSKAVSHYTQNEPIAILSQIDKSEFYDQCSQRKLISHLSKFTFFEQLMIFSIQTALDKISLDPIQQNVLLLFSTTKGNIDLLDQKSIDLGKDRVHIWKSIELITQYFKNPNQSVIISNACISGTQSLLVAKNILLNSEFEYIIVCGADIISPFVVSGFQSFKALSSELCKPFDLNRMGLNIGEGAATVILTKNQTDNVIIQGGAVTNDANHISGPSRTGEGLYRAICKTIESIDTTQISFINAHGTATPFNDEMEAIAIQRNGLTHIPTNSYKGYFGHTLGSAGVIETIISAHCLQEGIILPTLGFDTLGVSEPIKITKDLIYSTKPYCLKTASGFGGCNAALLLQKGAEL